MRRAWRSALRRGFTLASPIFSAVPEPASWALILTGFGFADFALRRRKIRVSFAA